MTDDATPPTDGPEAGPPDGIDPAQLRTAMKAFRKRLKLARLDDESRLGHGPLSGGGKSGIVAIRPPDRYPPAIWEELVRQGRLRRAGHGLLALADEN